MSRILTVSTHFALVTFAYGLCAPALAKDHIVPAMINIPAGTFVMGNDSGNAKAKPAHHVSLDEFQLAKYPVTVREFRQFVEDTGFSPTPSCSDFIGDSWFNSPEDSSGSATWDEHRFQHSEYQPVTCISWQEANQYAEWLSDKTGIDYRLPTEQEFEYAIKGGTTSRFFWGDDESGSQACQYGNFADHSGEHIPNIEYGASYVGFLTVANCDDGEAYNSIVGLYRPNPFGLYDIVGNIAQYTSTCYYEGYHARTEQEMDNSQCEYISHRGGTWHFPPQPHADRGRTKRIDETEWALMGFRLAADGHRTEIHESTADFERQLKAAQDAHLATQQLVPLAPKKPALILSKEGQQVLHWLPSQDSRVTNYEIYQSDTPKAHILGGFYQKYYHKIATVPADTLSIPVKVPNEGGSFRVVAKTASQTGLPSEAVYQTKTSTLELPAKIQMEDVHALHNVYLSHRPANDGRPEIYYLSRFHPGYIQSNVNATFKVNVEKSGWYQVNYRGRSMIDGKFFTIWSNNTLLASIDFSKDIDDKTSNRHRVYLNEGEHALELDFTREGFDYWNLVWLEFSLVKN